MIPQADHPIYFDWFQADVLGAFLSANRRLFLDEAEQFGYERNESDQMFKDILDKINTRIAE